MRLHKKVGIIGCGNMGRSILAGLIRCRVTRPGNIWVYEVLTEKIREVVKEFGIRKAQMLAELAKKSDVIVLAIKPQDLKTVSLALRPLLTPRHLVISILAGVPLARIKKELGAKMRAVRAMPNLGATIGESVTAVTGSKKGDLRTAEAIFSGCGEVIRLPERSFDLVTALSGSGPAYFFYLMELLVREGKRHGLSEEAASSLVKQTAKGASLLAFQSREPISVLRHRVTSKGGTTEAALKTLEEGHFPGLAKRAIANAIRRAKVLGRG